MRLTRITQPTEANVERIMRSYAASFDVRSFYVIRGIFAGLPEDEAQRFHLAQLGQMIYRSLRNPRHEIWAVLDSDVPPGSERSKDIEVGEEKEGEVVGVMVLKLPHNGENEEPTPYDEILASRPAECIERSKILEDHVSAIKALASASPETKPHDFHISFLGTIPRVQGKGVGSALVRYAIRRAAEAGTWTGDGGETGTTGVRLSTHAEDKVEFYGRFGFEVTGHAEWELGGIPFRWWTMAAYPSAA